MWTLRCFSFNITSVHFWLLSLQSSLHNSWMGLDTKLDWRWWHLDATWAISSGLLLLLICCTAREVLSNIYRHNHIQIHFRAFVQAYLLCNITFSHSHMHLLWHTLYNLLYWNTETLVKSKYSIPFCWIKCLQWLFWCWLIDMAPTLMKM